MKLLPTIAAVASAYEQPKYNDFLDSLSQKSSGWGHPTDKVAALFSLCPALPEPDNASIVCDQATCAMVCNEGFVATGRRRTKCRFNNANGFFWKRQLGGCDTCADLAAPPAGVDVTCGFNSRGKKKCVYKCANGEDIQSGASSWGAVTSLCACPRWNNRVCGWNTRKMGGMITDADIAGFTCPAAPTTTEPATTTPQAPVSTTAAPGTTGGPATTTGPAPPATTTAAPPAPSTTAPPPPPTTTAPPPPPTTTQAPSEFEPLTNNIPSSLTTCTVGARTALDKIVNGVDATQTHWPWIARLFLKETVGAGSGFQCGGAIINENWIISAAHCCEGIVEIDATLNDAAQNSFESGEFTVTSTNIFNHPGYGDISDGSGSNMDICLIKYNDNLVTGRTGTAPVCLSTAYPDHGKACWVAGWGTTSEGGNTANLLQSVGVNILGQDYCTANTNNSPLLPDDICAGLPDLDGNGLTDAGIDSCQGDSGGPLVCDVNGAATLVGVVSRGVGCAREGFPGIYTAIHTDDWVAQTIAANP